MSKAFTYLFILLLTLSCTHTISNENEANGLVSDQAMVVSAHPLASKVGVEIMRQGGNAADAAVAVEFALAVVYPDAGNIGGGGFIVLRQNDGSTDALDYREEAPAAADRNMYLDEHGEVIEGLSQDGHLAAGVPGTVDGMVKLHEKYGSMPWKALVQPAIDLASDGFPLTEKEAEKLNDYRLQFIKFNTHEPLFVREDEWEKGEIIKIPTLAATLERIRDHKAAGFYKGITADLIVAEMERGGGMITKEDLEGYNAIWREPVTGNFKEYRIISMPPPSSGGIALIQLLNITEEYPLYEWGWRTAKTAHLMIEAERRVYADRAKYLGDPAYYDVPVEGLLDEDYILQRMGNYSNSWASDSDDISAGNPYPYEGPSTTHYSIVDPMGNAISATTTLNSTFGSKVFVDGAGFFLNNQMNDFSIKPGYPNQYGLIGGEANAIEPGKRMLSSMTPTILEKDGELLMVVGSMGGSTIITTVYQIILNVTVFDFSAQEAISAKRFHHQWKPDWVLSEPGALGAGTGLKLWLKGHKIAPKIKGGIGRAEAIVVLPDGRLQGGADPRGDDAAAGF
ncbi:MAG: gamma-glutamyltransferase [Candidatus Cyclobacteriaceae bacterium M2_1C_046]